MTGRLPAPNIGAMNKNPIEDVISAAGGVTALAKRLGIAAPTVSQWRSGLRPVSPRLSIAITREFPGLVSVNELRPDVFGEPVTRRAG